MKEVVMKSLEVYVERIFEFLWEYGSFEDLESYLILDNNKNKNMIRSCMRFLNNFFFF